MRDPYGRTISYLRVSVTDRCDFRCVYCMAEDMTFLPKSEILSLEELDRVCSAFVQLGVRKLRLTGGEPLVRRDIMTLFKSLGRHLESGALDELTVTTNGSQSARHAEALREAGVKRVNVSLDTLDPAKFAAITRWGKLDKVLAGMEAAKQAGLSIKINTVALKGVNEDECDRLIAWCGAEGFDLTSSRSCRWARSAARPVGPVFAAVVAARAACQAVDARRDRLPHRRPGTLCAGARDRAAARVHHPADPQFLRKLQPRAADLHRHALYVPRPGGCGGSAHGLARERDDEALIGAIHEAIARKPKGHDFIIDRRHTGPAVGRHMSVTGG